MTAYSLNNETRAIVRLNMTEELVMTSNNNNRRKIATFC